MPIYASIRILRGDKQLDIRIFPESLHISVKSHDCVHNKKTFQQSQSDRFHSKLKARRYQSGKGICRQRHFCCNYQQVTVRCFKVCEKCLNL